MFLVKGIFSLHFYSYQSKKNKRHSSLFFLPNFCKNNLSLDSDAIEWLIWHCTFYFSIRGSGRRYYCLPIFVSLPQRRIYILGLLIDFRCEQNLLGLIKLWAEASCGTSRQKLSRQHVPCHSLSSVTITGMFWMVSFSSSWVGLDWGRLLCRAPLLISWGHMLLWEKLTSDVIGH